MKIVISTPVLLFAVQALTASAASDLPPSPPTSGFYEDEWLQAHNDRREYYHKANGKSVVQLTWNTELAEKAKTWAEKNANECKNNLDDKDYGFNGSMRNGVKRKGLQLELTPEWALNLWENQKMKGYPKNEAWTQVLWRPSKYVGCYTAVNTVNKCSAGVCYYAKPGNCSMGEAKGATKNARDVWRQKVYADESYCPCPPELEECETTSKPTKKPAK